MIIKELVFQDKIPDKLAVLSDYIIVWYLITEKRMSVRSDAASYGATTELHQDGLDDGNGLERQALCSW